MAKEKLSSMLEEKVSQWLEANGAKYLYNPNFSQYRSNIDFLITKPFQVAIEVFSEKSHYQNISRKAKRFLALRLAIAERFGPFVPFIAITTDNPENTIPFIDAVFSIDNLPNLGKLPELVKLDGDFQEIFEKGKPRNIKESFEFIESEYPSLSMEDLLFFEDFLQNTLAEKLHNFLKSRINLSASEYLQFKENNEQYLSDLDRRLFSVKISEEFNELIQYEVISKLGGKFKNQRIQVPGKQLFSLKILEWEAPNGELFVIRNLRTSQHFTFDKSQELYADAWIARAYKNISQDNFILLIGSSGTHVTKTIKGIKVVTQKIPIDLKAVNIFQASGWNVFPWDFAEIEPSFIKFLRGRI